MTTILPCHCHHKKYALSRERQQNLEFDDHVDYKVQVGACTQLEYTNLEKMILSLTISCEYWCNDDHSSMPLSPERKTE